MNRAFSIKPFQSLNLTTWRGSVWLSICEKHDSWVPGFIFSAINHLDSLFNSRVNIGAISWVHLVNLSNSFLLIILSHLFEVKKDINLVIIDDNSKPILRSHCIHHWFHWVFGQIKSRKSIFLHVSILIRHSTWLVHWSWPVDDCYNVSWWALCNVAGSDWQKSFLFHCGGKCG